MSKQMLVPLYGSPLTTSGLALARILARATHAEVVLLRVMPSRKAFPRLGGRARCGANSVSWLLRRTPAPPGAKWRYWEPGYARRPKPIRKRSAFSTG
jgi:hypothetical protein